RSQSRAVLSSLTEISKWPSGLNAPQETEPLWNKSVVTGEPVNACHTRAVLSSEAVTTQHPSGLNAAQRRTSLPCRNGGARTLPVAASHIIAVSSSLAVNTRSPPGLNAADLTRSRCRSGGQIISPVTTSQT